MNGLKYPILMVHGMGFRDGKRINYWGRIPNALEEKGARIYYGGQDSNGSIEGNARQLEKALEFALADSGAEKVNMIAHSKGGLEARYLISTMGYEDSVASLTTVSTPHNGSVTVDRLLKHTRPLVRFGCKAADLWFWLSGDKEPHTYEAVRAFETSSAADFNRNNPDSDKVYYQSYACVMKKPASDILMSWTWLVVNHFEGENDGLLSPASAKWTNFRGIKSGSGKRGISHCDEVDMRRRRFSRSTGSTDEDISDITELYLEIAEDLRLRGF